MHPVLSISSESLSPAAADYSNGIKRQPTFQNPFSDFVMQASQQMSALRADADDRVKGLMVGDGTDIHTALIATQKADLAFDLALAVRNKVVGAYQQLIGMQF